MKKKAKRKDYGCYPQCHYATSREFVDYDYVKELSDKDAEWLGNFSDNYYSGRFKKDDDANPIKDRRDCYRRAHKQRRDFMSAKTKQRVNLTAEQAEYIEAVDATALAQFLEGVLAVEVDDED